MANIQEISALVSEHGEWLSAFLRGLTHCEADADDSFQEVWLRLLKQRDAINETSMRAYLVKVARSVMIDRYRRNERYELTLDAPCEDETSALSSLMDEAPPPDEKVEAHSTHDDVLAHIRALPKNLRLVVLMRIEGELTFQEIADELKVPLGTVLTWMRSATTKLKMKINPHNELNLP